MKLTQGGTTTKKVRFTTTLKMLRDAGACADGYRKLKRSLGAKWGDDKPINLLHILKSNGVQDMLWALRCTREDNVKMRVAMAASFAQSVLHHYTAKYPTDTRVADCIKTCFLFSQGRATIEQLRSAASAARSAESAASAAWSAESAARSAESAAELKKQAAIIRSYLK